MKVIQPLSKCTTEYISPFIYSTESTKSKTGILYSFTILYISLSLCIIYKTLKNRRAIQTQMHWRYKIWYFLSEKDDAKEPVGGLQGKGRKEGRILRFCIRSTQNPTWNVDYRHNTYSQHNKMKRENNTFIICERTGGFYLYQNDMQYNQNVRYQREKRQFKEKVLSRKDKNLNAWLLAKPAIWWQIIIT